MSNAALVGLDKDPVVAIVFEATFLRDCLQRAIADVTDLNLLESIRETLETCVETAKLDGAEDSLAAIGAFIEANHLHPNGPELAKKRGAK